MSCSKVLMLDLNAGTRSMDNGVETVLKTADRIVLKPAHDTVLQAADRIVLKASVELS